MSWGWEKLTYRGKGINLGFVHWMETTWKYTQKVPTCPHSACGPGTAAAAAFRVPWAWGVIAFSPAPTWCYLPWPLLLYPHQLSGIGLKYGHLRCFHSSKESLRRWLLLFCFSHQEPSWAGVCITFISEPPAASTGVLWCLPNSLSTVYHCSCPRQYVLFYILKVNSLWNKFFLKANPSGAVKYIRFDVLGHDKLSFCQGYIVWSLKVGVIMLFEMKGRVICGAWARHM